MHSNRALLFYNNIISDVSAGGYHVELGEYPVDLVASEFSNNIFYQPGDEARIHWGKSGPFYNVSEFQVATGKCAGCIEKDPLFVDAGNNDFSLYSRSPAIDACIEHSIYQLFEDSFGIDIRKDIEGRTRPQDGDSNGSAEWDIGAYEYVEESLPSSNPFVQIWNWLKGLLTTKTGNAILTGNVINGNAVNETNETGNGNSGILYIILFLFVIMAFIIAGVIVKTKKKSKER